MNVQYSEFITTKYTNLTELHLTGKLYEMKKS